MENQKERNGLFTHWLVKGLKGLGFIHMNQDKFVTINSLLEWIQHQLPPNQIPSRLCIYNPTGSILFQLKKPIWNGPKENPHFIKRQEILDKLESSFFSSNEQENRTIVMNAFSGLGGVGKTQLALYYFYHSNKDYSIRCWINSENEDQIIEQYSNFRLSLGLFSINNSNNNNNNNNNNQNEEKDIKQQAKLMKHWFEQHSNWLIVFDNAENPSLLKEWIPHTSNTNRYQNTTIKEGEEGRRSRGGDILITSRNQNWEETNQMIEIDVMTDLESIELFKIQTGRTNPSSEELEGWKELMKLFRNLPLAISQSASYMKQTKISSSKYLQFYKEYEKKLIISSTTSPTPLLHPKNQNLQLKTNLFFSHGK